MSTPVHDSNLHFAEVSPAKPAPSGPEPVLHGRGGMTLDGDVLACPCPDCKAPMSIRVWLMTADCWLCGTSIELTLEQQQEAERLLERREQAQKQRQREAAKRKPQELPVSKPPAATATETVAKTKSPPQKKPAPPSSSPPPPARQSPRSEPQAKAPPPVPAPPSQTPRERAAEPRPATHAAAPLPARHGNPWIDITAWLISAVFHAVLILLLGLWTFSDYEEDRTLVLSATLSPAHRTGGVEAEEELNETEFELPVVEKPKNKAQREALIKANQDAKELRLDLPEAQRNLPKLARVKEDLKSTDPYRRMQAARDPRVRAEIVRREGGTTLTEASVARALRWIAAQQKADGSWSLQQHGASVRSDTAATAMSLMAMLGTGQTHKVGRYRDNVAAGLSWLLQHQKPNGDLRANSSGNTGMYAHGQAALVLCDAFKVTGDETLRAPAQRAIEFICAAQHPQGGWRYSPGEAGDTSVVGWQLMALHSAKAAYLNVPREHLDLADNFLDRVQGDKQGGLYGYRSSRDIKPSMTAEGLLCRMYLGWNRDDAGLKKGVNWLVENHLPNRKTRNIYYWYYGTQVMHHWGGEPWERWNTAMRDVLVTSQETSGPNAGSWSPGGHPHGGQGGRLYVTALAACTLEVYYRYAPLYYQIELD